MKYHVELDPFIRPGEESKNSFRKWAIKNIKSKNGIVMVVEEDGKIIGYMMGFVKKIPTHLVFKKVGKITDAFVSENYRRGGIGRIMLDEITEWFKTKNLKYMETLVHIGNNIGVSAWESFGFKKIMVGMRKKIK